MKLKQHEIELVVQKLKAGELTDDQVYQQQALANLADTDYTVPALGAIALGVVGMALLGPFGAIGAAAIAGSNLYNRYRKNEELRDRVELGDPKAIAAALPKDLKPAYPVPIDVEATEPSPKSLPPAKPDKVPTFHPSVERLIEEKTSPAPINPPHYEPKPIPDTNSDMSPASQSDVTPLPVTSFESTNTDTAQLIADRGLRCHLFIGGSGTGKSLLASTSARKLQQSRPDAVFWIVSAKCDSDESGYWTGFDRYSFWDFVGGGFELKAAAFEEWLNIIEEFKRLNCPGLLLFDELSLILGEAELMAKSSCREATIFKEQFCSLLNVFASAGRSTQKAVWGISPTGAMNGLGGIKRSTVGPFMSIFNAKPGKDFHYSVWKDASTNGLAPAMPPSYDNELKAKQLGCTLLTGLGDSWTPCQRYEVPPIDDGVIGRFRLDRPRSQPIPTIAFTPPAAPPPVTVLPSIEDSIKGAIALGMGKTETLKSLGINPGGNKQWKSAAELYDQLKGATNEPGRMAAIV